MSIRFLIADNSTDYASLLSNYLSAVPDIDVVGIAEDGDKAIRMIHDKSPDVLLLDILMPIVDGLEVLEEVKSMGNRPLVFMISALRNDDVVSRALSLGANCYFVKPVKMDLLISKIKEACFDMSH